MNLQLIVLALGAFALLSTGLYFTWQSREYWKAYAEKQETVIEQHKKNEGIVNDYVQNLDAINDRHIARGMLSMSCLRNAAGSPDAEEGATRFGNPYPAISAHQRECEAAISQLNALIETLEEGR